MTGEGERDKQAVSSSDQAHQVFDESAKRFRDQSDAQGSDGAGDDSAVRFRAAHDNDSFSGASSVLFEQAMGQTRMAICLVDPHGPDQPIVFANRAFRQLTGYPEEEILGRNCRFLQGPETDPEQVAKLRNAIARENVAVVELLNYRRDGSSFWNALHIGPIYDERGKLIYFFGSQWDVSDVLIARADEKHAKAMARELSHRMKNMFAVMGGIVSITGRAMDATPVARKINERIQALARAYEPTLDEASHGTIEVGQAIQSVLAPYENDGNRIIYKGNGLRIDPNFVSTMGLALYELATNAVEHGALSQDGGRIEVDWYSDKGRSQTLVVDWLESGGPPIDRPPSPNAGSGFDIVDSLLVPTRGTLARNWTRDGLHARLMLPITTSDLPGGGH